jgi:predicted phage tail protein
MITVYLEGVLAEQFTPAIALDVTCVAEAVQGLSANFPSFRRQIGEMLARGIRFVVRVGSKEIGEEFLRSPIASKVRSIRIIPVPAGYGSNGGAFAQIAIGVGLIALSLTGVGILGVAPATLALMGGVMVARGIMSLIFGQVKDPASQEDEGGRSLIWGQPQQTIKEGGRMPRLYGRHKVGHYIISGAIRTYFVEDDDDD